ncbi:Polysaccharide pyruvyl transferase [anaerobic digester metagenome]|jgi:polysaccharide pyruvyl transferase WcaK-like protein
MIKVAILDTNSSANKGSMGRLDGMIKCLDETIPGSQITVLHRYYDLNNVDLKQLGLKYPQIKIKDHPWFMERNSFVTTGFHFIYNTLFFKILNKKRLLTEYDVLIDLNFIEPEKLVDKFSLINFMGVLFVLLSLKNTINSDKPVVVCSATIGPYGNFFNKLAKKYLNEADLITYREAYSQKYVDSLGVEVPKKVLTGDLAFLMDPINKDDIRKMISKLNIDIDDSFIGITPAAMANSNFSEETNVKLLKDISNFIIGKTDYKIIFLANTYQDVELQEKIYNSVEHPERVISLPFDYSASETKSIISLCDLFICSRFHALVASTSLRVPSIGLVSYSYNKFHGILGEMMGQEEYLLDINDKFDYETFLSNFQSKILDILQNKSKIKEDLTTREKFVRKQVLLNGELINNLLKE